MWGLQCRLLVPSSFLQSLWLCRSGKWRKVAEAHGSSVVVKEWWPSVNVVFSLLKLSCVANKQLSCVSRLPPVQREEGDPCGRKLAWALLIIFWKVLGPPVSNYYSLLIHQDFPQRRGLRILGRSEDKMFWDERGFVSWRSVVLTSRATAFYLLGFPMGWWLCAQKFPCLDEKWQILPLVFRPGG